MGARVTIYTTTYCAYCVMAKRLLKQKDVPYEEIDVGERRDLRAWLAEVSRQRTVPQIFINGGSVGGYTELAALDRRGALDPLLARDPEASDPPIHR